MSGARAGQRLAFAQRVISVGRAATADLRFDPEADRAVSASHALLLFEGGMWFVRDLGSRNGTFLNGRRLEGDAAVAEGDRIGFGEGGPVVEFRTMPVDAPARGAPRAEGTTGRRLRIQLQQRTRRLRGTFGMVTLALVGALGASLYLGARQRNAWTRERASLRVQLDSIERVGDRAVETLELQMGQLREALARSEAAVEELSTALHRAEAAGEVPRARELQRELRAASAVLRNQQTAATLDFRALQRGSRPAVARVFVEYASGEVVTATAFAVRPDARLVTSRHVVHEGGGGAPRRIAVQFADSEQVWPARLLAVSEGFDLAIVKVDNILGEVPSLRRFNLRPDTLPAGAPLALIGFPRGGDLDAGAGAERRNPVARPVLTAGVLLSASPSRVEVQGYGSVGASGSPILDANGEVVGVLFGGREGERQQVLVGVPGPVLARTLAAVP